MKSRAKQFDADLREHYVQTICNAVATHGPCSPLSHSIKGALESAFAVGIRAPNDWCFHYTGVAEFRWHDGGAMYRDCTKSIMLHVRPDSLEIHGRLEKGYSGEGGISIKGLTQADAITILWVLVGCVDAKVKSDTSS